MKTLVIGASGQIGKMATQKLLEQEQQVVALVRDKSKLSDVNSPNLEVIEQDLEGDFERAFKGCEQVIFSAGSGGNTDGDKTLLIDLWAAKKAIDYAKANSLSRFIMVSSIGADDPDAIESDLKPYLVAKHMADEHLLNSGLSYTIVRPGSLIDEPATQVYSTERPDTRDNMIISRENVAEALVYLAQQAVGKSRAFELYNGEHRIEDTL